MQKRYCEFWFNFVTPCLQLRFLYCVLEEQEPSDWCYTKVAFPRIHEPWINVQAQWGMIWESAYREKKLYTSEAYSMLQTNYIFCINILIAQSHDKNYSEGSRLNPPKVPCSWGKANPGSSQPYWCHLKGLSMPPSPAGLFPHASAGLLFPCHPPRGARVQRTPVPSSVPLFTSRSALHL